MTSYWAAPSGFGVGTQASPFQIAEFFAVAAPGDTLWLQSGVYTGANSMIAPTSGLNGTSGNPITIQAVSEGGVVINGQSVRSPLNLNNNSYWQIIGVNVENSVGSAAVIQNGSNNNTFLRCGAWNGNATGNYHVWSVDGSSNNLFEDCFGFGTGRTTWDNFTSDGNVFRRCFGNWQSTQDSAVKLTGQLNYDSTNTTVENCIFTWNPAPGTNTSQLNDILGHGPNNSANREIFFNIRGTFLYVRPGHAYGSPEYYLGVPRNDEIHLQDVLVVAPSDESVAKPAWLGNCKISDVSGTNCASPNLTADDTTLIGTQASDVESQWVLTNVQQGASVSAVYGTQSAFVNDGTKGATLCYRYIDGVLTSLPLWPWPMNQRIIDAMTFAGESPIDVTAEVELILGTIPAQCTGFVPVSGGPAPGGSGGGSGAGAGSGAGPIAPGGPVPVSATKKWLVLGRIYADSGLQAFASTRVRHPSWTYEPFVINWGYIERNISTVSGLPEVGYATIEMADNHRHWRDILSTETLRRRYFDLKLVPDGGSESAGETLFVGEVDDWETSAGKVTFTLKDRLFSWLDEPIPAMLIPELYPTILPENVGGFLPIIFGECRSTQSTPLHRGMVPCPPFGPIGSPVTAYRYGLSMTRVANVVQVYRTFINGLGQEEVELVSASEYVITEVAITAFNVDMFHQFLDFTADQSGAEITADVDGIYERGEYGPLPAIVPGSPIAVLRNPIDAWINAVYVIMSKIGTPLSVTDSFEIGALRTKFESPFGSPGTMRYVSGLISEPLTGREWLGQFLPSFNLFMPQNRNGLITLKLMEHANTTRAVISEGQYILRGSFKERPPEKISTQIVYNYQFNHSTKRPEATEVYDSAEQLILATLNQASPQVIQPGIEKEDLDLVFVGDADTAAAAAVERASFLSLGSFRQEFAVPTPPTMAYIDLAEQIGLTHSQGLAPGGYVDEEVFITGITFDIANLSYLCRSVRRVPQSLYNPLITPPSSIVVTPCPTFSAAIRITIDHTQLPVTETNFVVGLEITDPRLRTVANGGSVENVNGYDIRPTLSITCADLTYELEEDGYDGAAGTVLMWVLLPTVNGNDTSMDTFFQLNFGNPSLTTDGSSNATWSGYGIVTHLNVINGGIYCTRDSVDFTTPPGTPWHNLNTVSAITSQIGNGGSFDGANFLRHDGSALLVVGTQDFTMSFWIKTTASTVDILGRINSLICVAFPIAHWYTSITGGGKLFTKFQNHDGSQIQSVTSATTVNDNALHHCVITRSGNTVKIYIDGALDVTDTAAYTVDVIDDGGAVDFGVNTNAVCSPYYVGSLDEVRCINDAAWDADRVAAEYNNQKNTKNPSTFYTVT